MSAAPVLFFDVEPEDRALVLERFPDASFADASLSGDALVGACAGAEIVSVFINTPFPADVIRRLPDLRLLCTRSVGYDHIDTDACRAQGITVCNVPDYGSHVIAEHVFALLLSALRRITEGSARTGAGLFDYHGLRGMALKGKTLGIVGTGKIGARVARIAYGFDMRILAVDQCRNLELEERWGVRYVTLDELLPQADVLTLHLPATPETRHLIGADAFACMKRGVSLVNTARGSLIDTPALIAALDSGIVAHALLDVLEHEQNFAEDAALVRHPGVVATPHIAFYADDSMRSMFLDCFESIDQWKRGAKPAHTVRPIPLVCDLPPMSKAS